MFSFKISSQVFYEHSYPCGHRAYHGNFILNKTILLYFLLLSFEPSFYFCQLCIYFGHAFNKYYVTAQHF
jgi:hypothetical protein